MLTFLKNNIEVFGHYRPLLGHLVTRDIKVKYRRSALGFMWSILNPLLMMTVQSLVFSTMFGDGSKNYHLYILTGSVIFGFYSESTSLAMDSVLGGAGLIKKVYIPKYIFPLEKVIFSLVNTGFSLVAMVAVMAVTQLLSPSVAFFSPVALSGWTALFWVPILMIFIFNLGVGLALSALTVYFRDIKHFYGVFVTALTYFTPLFYPKDRLPEFLQSFLRVNPVYWYVTLFRRLVLEATQPSWTEVVAPALFAIFALVVGLFIFKKTQDDFILHM